MRRLSAFRASTAVAVVAALVAVLAVMFPGLGIGAPTTSHGGSPTDVFTNTEPEICAQVDTFGTAPTMVTQVSALVPSNLVVYFTSEWSGLDPNTELLVSFVVNDDAGNFVVGTPFEWGTSNNLRIHGSGTVMWTFDNVQPGVYRVNVDARTDPVPGSLGGANNPNATLENCALTVFVTPVAPPPPIP